MLETEIRLLDLPELSKEIAKTGEYLAPNVTKVLLVSSSFKDSILRANSNVQKVIVDATGIPVPEHLLRPDYILSEEGTFHRLEVNIGNVVGIHKCDLFTQIAKNLTDQMGFNYEPLAKPLYSTDQEYLQDCFLMLTNAEAETSEYNNFAKNSNAATITEDDLASLIWHDDCIEFKGIVKKYLIAQVSEIAYRELKNPKVVKAFREGRILPTIEHMKYESKLELATFFDDEFAIPQENVLLLDGFTSSIGVHFSTKKLEPYWANKEDYAFKLSGGVQGKFVILGDESKEDIEKFLSDKKYVDPPIVALQKRIKGALINGKNAVFKMFTNGNGLIYLSKNPVICGSMNLLNDAKLAGEILPILVDPSM